MASELIGAIRATLGLDSASFEKGATRAEQKWRSSTENMQRQTLKLSNAVKGLAATFTTYFTGRELVGLIDSYTRLQNQLKVAGYEGEKLLDVQQRLTEVATKYGVSLESVGTLFGRNSASAKELNLNFSQQLRIVEATSAALKIQGSSTEAASGALLQLSQLLGGVKVQAQEYNSLIDGARPLLQAVAAGSDRWGGSVAKLTQDVKASKVTVQEFTQALLAGSGTVIDQAAQSTLTLGGAFENLRTALINYVGEAATSSGAQKLIANALDLLSKNLETVINLLGILVAMMAVRYVAAAAAFVRSTTVVQVALFAIQARAAGAATSLEAMSLAGATAGRTLLAALGGPLGVTILGLGAAFYLAQHRVEGFKEASAEYANLESQANQVRAKAEDAALKLASATGKAARAAKENAARTREEANAMLANAKAALAAARAKAQAALSEAKSSGLFGGGFFSNVALGTMTTLGVGPGPKLLKANADLDAANAAVAAGEAALNAFVASPFSGGGGGDAGDGKGKTKKDRTGDFKSQLSEMRTAIDDAFDTRNLPQAMETAKDMRKRLSDIADEARKAGVPTGQFADQIAALNAQIDGLELDGLVKEAALFAEAVWESSRSVENLDNSAMTPLSRKLADVNDQYGDLRKRIEEQIKENAALASVNADAARSLAQLKELLVQLEKAHENATAAALAQYRAEQELRDLSAQQAQQQIGLDITGLQRARGDFGFETSQQEDMRKIEEQLQSERLQALIQLKDYEAQLSEARQMNDAEEAARLTGIIDLQQQYYDLVSETTAEQIVASQRLQDAFSDFTDGLSDALFNMVTKFDFSLKSLGDVFLKLLNDIFLKPAIDSLAGSIGSFLQGTFAGGFATGGVIPRGSWGIVGERGPEPIFAGDASLRVFPNDTMGGGGGRGDTYNITVSGAMSDRDARRTGSQIAVGLSKTQAAKRKAGLAG